MSRIDEALRQAGVKQPSSSAGATQQDTLNAFPLAVEPREQPRAAATEHHEADPVVSGPQPIFFERLVVHHDAAPVAIEQYRRLAAVLHHSQVERGNKVVMVASAQPAEGKTLTAANLALTLSESYRRRVLLIDADLRRPSLNRLFQLPHGAGLSDNLKADQDMPLQLMTLSPSLSLLPGGNADADPMSGLTSGRMQQIIDRAAANFDWVIVDTPPVALLTDTHLLAAMVDSAVLVIDAGHTPFAAVQQAIESIGRDKIVGVVLNRVEQNVLEESSYSDYYRASSKKRRAPLGGALAESQPMPGGEAGG